jgi:hypothetical protein
MTQLLNSTGGSVRRALDSNVATFGIHVAMRWNAFVDLGAYTAMDLSMLDSAGGYQLGLRCNNNGALELYRSTSSTAGTLLFQTAGGIITLGVWHSIRLASLISDTVGAPVVKVDNSTVISLANQDTKNTANANVGFVELGHSATSGGSSNVSYDDIWCIDSLDVPLRRVETLYPSSDGATLNLVPSSGVNHFAVVDEAQVSTADYLSGSVVGEIDLLGLTNLSSTPATIDELNVISTAQKTDATGRAISNGLKSGATTSNGPDLSLAIGFTRLDRPVALDPNTGLPWLPADVNGLELQPRVAV